MNRIQTITALLILKQPQLFEKLTVELNGAHYVYRAVRTEQGVTVRFGQKFNDRDLQDLLPRVAEQAVAVLLDAKWAELVTEQGRVRRALSMAREFLAVTKRHGGQLMALSDSPLGDDWSTTNLATQFLALDMERREHYLSARLRELDAMLRTDEEEGSDV